MKEHWKLAWLTESQGAGSMCVWAHAVSSLTGVSENSDLDIFLPDTLEWNGHSTN